MIAVHMVQPAIHQIVLVVAMRHCFVAASRAMLVADAAASPVVAFVRVRTPDSDRMFLDFAVAILVMKVPVVEIIDMAVVTDGRVPAAGAVNMVVGVMVCVARHAWSLLP